MTTKQKNEIIDFSCNSVDWWISFRQLFHIYKWYK